MLNNLELAARRKKQAEEDRANAMIDIRRGVINARAAGYSIALIARKAGLSRQSVYTVLESSPRPTQDPTPLMDAFFGPKKDEGRLTECAGSWRDNDPFDESHPGCPYRKSQHIKHTFTLRD